PHQAALRLPLPHALPHPGAQLLGERAGPERDLAGGLGGVSGSRLASLDGGTLDELAETLSAVRACPIPLIRVGEVELFYQRSGPARPPSLVLVMGWAG